MTWRWSICPAEFRRKVKSLRLIFPQDFFPIGCRGLFLPVLAELVIDLVLENIRQVLLSDIVVGIVVGIAVVLPADSCLCPVEMFIL